MIIHGQPLHEKCPKFFMASHSVTSIFFFTELGVLICIHQAVQFTTVGHLNLNYPSFVIWAWVNLHQDNYIRNKHKQNEGRNTFLMAKKKSKLHQLKEIGNVNEFFNTMKVVNQHFQRPINLFRWLPVSTLSSISLVAWALP